MSRDRCKPLIGSADAVRRRVAYRLIERFYFEFPHLFKTFPPGAVLELAEAFRDVYPFLYPEIAWYARNMAAGFTLVTLRDSGWKYSNRALTKRKPAGPRRYD